MSVITDFDLLAYRRTKIVATLGPASDGAEHIEALIQAGVDVFRLNMSHGGQAGHARALERIRAAAQRLDRPVGVLADLCGPKIRTGRFAGGDATLETGAPVTVTTRAVSGDATLVPSQYASLTGDVAAGARILLADGAVELEVLEVEGTEIACRVTAGGRIADHQGINLPGADVSAPAFTEKDRADAEFALAQGVDYLALSFVRRAEDLQALRGLVEQAGLGTWIIAKIEKPQALTNAAGIIAAADGIMVARGDLGVELSPEQVPLAQHQLIEQARAANKPVIVATQMLESMISAPRPTRAEVTDVAHAVTAGADAVMLSGETAIGRHPLEAVRIMSRIAKQTEAFYFRRPLPVQAAPHTPGEASSPFGDAIADAAAQLTRDVAARAVVVISHRGTSAVTITAARPAAPVVTVTGDAAVQRRMSLLWGAIPVLSTEVGHANPNRVARQAVAALGIAQAGHYLVLVRGFHVDPALNTPSLTLLAV